jgi:penicillin-binding protein 1A
MAAVAGGRKKRKRAGARMDLRLSDDDRVAGSRRAGKAKPRKAPARGRVEIYADERRERRPAKARRKRSSIGGFFITLLNFIFFSALIGAAGVAAVVVYYGAQLPNQWAVPERPPNIRILAADGQMMSNRGKTGGEAASLRELPHFVPAAFVAIEDRRFYDHFGIDVIGLGSVALESISAGRLTRGASTITQQVAKNLFLSPDQTAERKIQEAILSLWLEQNYSKDEILELYLNRVFFGNNATGVEAASQVYFGKSARNLSLGEAAMLAATVQSPSRVNPKNGGDAMRDRQRLVLQAMAREGYISQPEAGAAAINPTETVRTKVAGSESYVADWVESLMKTYIGDVQKDVVVYTTINWDLQKEAEFIVREAVANEGKDRGFSQAALVAMDVDGAVRAVVGGVDYNASQYNRAVTARRQPGSTFKPFVYLAAMEKGYTPETVAEDAQFEYEGWSPANASNQYAGMVTLRQGLANSLNTVAARLAIDVGPQKVVEAAMRLGISSPMLAVPSIALGTSEVSLLEMVGAYGAFANGGQGVIPNVITRIETTDGQVLYNSVPAGPGQVIAPVVVAEMNDMLTNALEVGTGKRAHLDGWPIAGKTGTSQHARDAWFVGYSARMVAGVWLGNDDDTGTTLSGGNVPVDIWSQLMLKAHAGLPVAELPGAYMGGPIDTTLQPMEQPAPQRDRKTIVDLLGQLFGGG